MRRSSKPAAVRMRRHGFCRLISRPQRWQCTPSGIARSNRSVMVTALGNWQRRIPCQETGEAQQPVESCRARQHSAKVHSGDMGNGTFLRHGDTLGAISQQGHN